MNEKMLKRFWAIKDPEIKEIIELVLNLNNSLNYPHSENSNDERQYMNHYEKELLEIVNKGK